MKNQEQMKSGGRTEAVPMAWTHRTAALLAWVLVMVMAGGNGASAQVYTFGTLAGLAGSAGGNDGTGAAARFNQPAGVAVDGLGNVYVADEGNNTIRKVTPQGVVSTLAGLAGTAGTADGTGAAARFNQPANVRVDSAGNLYIADTMNHTIRKMTPQGVVTTVAGAPGNPGDADGTGSGARFNQPGGVAFDRAGNLYIADTMNHTIRKMTPQGVVTTVAGSPGNAGYADGTGSRARFNSPEGVAVDGTGNLYVADGANEVIRKVTPSGVVTTIAGSAGNAGSQDGVGSAARFGYLEDIAADGQGNLFVADFDNSTIREVTAGGVVTTVGGIAGNTGSADGAGNVAQFNGEEGVAVDRAGNLYVADTVNNTIRVGIPSRSITSHGIPVLFQGQITFGKGRVEVVPQR